MLVYEKKVDNERKLFGTMDNIPVEDDVELTYKDANATVITLVPGDSYIDDKKGGIIRKSDDKQVNVFIGDDMIVPANGEAPQPEPIPAEVETDIASKRFVAGAEEPVEFTISTKANDDAGIMVKGYADLDVTGKALVEYYEVQDGNWYEFIGGAFGPETGFPLSDVTSKFRVKFNEGTEGNYNLTASIKKVADSAVVCSINTQFTVEAAE